MAFYPCVDNRIDRLLDGSITTISSNITFLRNSAFRTLSTLTNVNLPELTNISGASFYGCTALPILDFPKVNTIGASAFGSCSNLSVLILRNNSVVSLANITAFSSTPFDVNGNGGKLYVPQSLISSYQNNATWSAVLELNANNQILAIEGSPYEV